MAARFLCVNWILDIVLKIYIVFRLDLGKQAVQTGHMVYDTIIKNYSRTSDVLRKITIFLDKFWRKIRIVM